MLVSVGVFSSSIAIASWCASDMIFGFALDIFFPDSIFVRSTFTVVSSVVCMIFDCCRVANVVYLGTVVSSFNSDIDLSFSFASNCMLRSISSKSNVIFLL